MNRQREHSDISLSKGCCSHALCLNPSKKLKRGIIIMECNKEEASRAKQIAEIRMQNNDFNGALRIAQKAHHLFPELENVLQLLAVCEVHCSAQKKVFGTEVDWYAILQVDKTADEIALKKQFRKLALLLHPDKNKFAGAEAAFKLIGEGNRVLSDRESRSLYDMKCRNLVVLNSSHAPKPPAHQQMQNSGSGNHNGTGIKQESRPPHFQPGGPDSSRKDHVSNQYQQAHLGTFWTCCPSCRIMYQYFKYFIGKSLRCQSCGAAFIAQELCTQDFGQPFQHGQSASRTKFSTVEFSKPDARNKGVSSSSTQSEDRSRRRDGAKGTAGSAQNESDPGQNNTDTDGAYPFGRSSRQKQRVFAKKNLDGKDDFVRPRKRARSNGADSVDKGCQSPHGKHEPECDEAGGLVRCPNPEFNDFDKLRSDFAADQVWACYDKDGMPRYYAQIKKVLSPGFKLQFIWLEAVPKSEAEVDWSHKGLPVACGYFRMGRTEETEDQRIFSHQVCCAKFPRKSRERLVHFAFYPRKGEIWAVFKNWDIKWSSDPKKHLPYRYEYVEVLSDFEEDSGVRVACLRRLSGFVSLYQRVDVGNAGQDGFYQIPTNEKYRFSHRVPSFKMTGEKRADVPAGSLELDPASLDLDELQYSLKKERAQMRFHSIKLDSNFGNKMANSGKISGGENRMVVMGLSAQFLVRKLNLEPGRTGSDQFLAKVAGTANKEHKNVSTVGGGSLNLSRPNTSSSCFNSLNIPTKEDPTKSEKGSNNLRRSSRVVNKMHSCSGS